MNVKLVQENCFSAAGAAGYAGEYNSEYVDPFGGDSQPCLYKDVGGEAGSSEESAAAG